MFPARIALIAALLVASFCTPDVASGLDIRPTPQRVEVELTGTAVLTLNITTDVPSDVSVTVSGNFSKAELRPLLGVLIIRLKGQDERNSYLFQLFNVSQAEVAVVFDASDWFSPGKFSEERSFTFNVTANEDTEEINVTVCVLQEWETHVTAEKFVFALLPLIVIFLGIAVFRQDGMTMSLLGWAVAALLAVLYFHSSSAVVLGATGVGIVKAFGISIAVLFTMLMIFIMKETGALEEISKGIKGAVRHREEQALFIGIGAGSFLTSLGVTTPALFPPLLIAMGFTPFAAVVISVLGYNATTSFALLSIPITLPSEIGHIDPALFAWKISLFLPVLSVAISLAMLWFIGGRDAVRRGLVPALLSGLVIALSCLLFVWTNLHPLSLGGATFYVPLRVVGVFAGLLAMIAIFWYHHWHARTLGFRSLYAVFRRGKGVSSDLDPKKLLIALSPWITLTLLAAVSSIEEVQTHLEALPGQWEVVNVFADQAVDLNVLSQIYTWILIATLITLPILRPTRDQMKNALTLWIKRAWRPFIAFSMYFAIAFIMSFSGMTVLGGRLIPSADFPEYNMNLILGTGIAVAFGSGFMLVAGSLGVFGAFVGGSETASNVMFLDVQRSASIQTDTDFLTAYGAHAAAGGIASAITPAKINNAVVLIGEKKELEGKVMRSHTLFVVICTVLIGIMTTIFVSLGL